MKLKKFKEKDSKKKGIILFTISCIALIMGVYFSSSFALFETNEQFNLIEGDILEKADLIFVFYKDNEITLDVPERNSNYKMTTKSYCTNNVTVSWDYENWQAVVNYENYEKEQSPKTKCYLYFSSKEANLKNTIVASSSKELVTDGTVDNNVRFVGQDPNNYVLFNNELWRIIGVMNNVTIPDGTKSSKIKLMKAESIGFYSWDTSLETINSGYGANAWQTADAMKMLNDGFRNEEIGGSLYWNRTNGRCYIGEKNANTLCDFKKNGLTAFSKTFIEKIIWNIGSNGQEDYTSTSGGLVNHFYNYERSENTGKLCSSGTYCNDGIPRTATWEGDVGLIYPSDYAYATEGNKEITRETCLQTPLWSWNDPQKEPCKINSWIYKEKEIQWTMTPFAYESESRRAFYISEEGNLYYYGSVHNGLAIHPVIYLKDNVKLVSGLGTKDTPFEIAF